MGSILLSYKPMSTHFFGDSYEFPYELTLKKTYFFGLFTKIVIVRYDISMFQSIKQHTDHWDDLIANKKPLKK